MILDETEDQTGESIAGMFDLIAGLRRRERHGRFPDEKGAG